MMSETARLARIRDLLAEIEPGRWTRVHDADGCFVEAEGPMGELLPVARFDAGAGEAEITLVTELPETVAFLLALVDRAIGAMRRAGAAGQPETRDAGVHDRAKDFAAECAMKCGEAAFKAFLEARHGLARPLTDERAAQKVRGLLAVTSRAELNHDGAAAERWKALRAEFDAWRREGR